MFTPAALPRIPSLNKAFTALAGTGAVTDFLPRRNNILNRSSRLVGKAPVSSLSTHKSRRAGKVAIDQEATAVKPERGEQDLNAVFDAMMFLPKDQRRILTMVCIHEMRYADVAEKLNMPVDRVRGLLSDARDALQHFLDGNTGNTPSPHLRQRN